MATRGGSKNRHRRGSGQSIQDGRPTGGKDLADGGVAIYAPLHSQWDGVRGAGMDGFSLPALRNLPP